MDIKLPDGYGNREEAIEAILREEIESAQAELPAIRKAVRRYLVEAKSYAEHEIETSVSVAITSGEETCESCADLIVSSRGKRALLIRCFAGALASRERHVLACARLLHSEYQIPYAMVTDGRTATLLNTISGKVLGEGLSAIPSRQELDNLMEKACFVRLEDDRATKEKRILLAFDSIKCSFPTEGSAS